VAFAVLASLAERPMHAYGLHRLLQERGKTELVHLPTRASVYPVLDRLARSGFVEVVTTERDAGRPERTVYRLTDAGDTTMRAWLLAYLASGSSERTGFALGLSYAMLAGPGEVAGALEERRARLERERDALRAGLADGARIGLPELFQLDEAYLLGAIDADVAHTEALLRRLAGGELTWDLEWIQAVAERLESPPA
jgi:DNA-binding PadR family transcriptional regulator